MTPQVDVMPVLLIIFLLTVPIMQHAVKIDLPHASSQHEDAKPTHVEVSVRAHGTVLWGDQVVDDAAPRVKIADAAQANPQPELHLRVDRTVAYEHADLMSEAQATGLSRIGFVTDPASGSVAAEY
ncbi:ExbD/TolR family protein [Paraburkholderia silvatlantica]|uniref:Biopolymer transport protein ExbD n=1 Tax=Paraburkholderia silvatlantica TaxID=321895 RepID=A0A2U1A9J6_9BURK|nr:biopolymer transporter ExbD [Paraburkholderia silvatlantica]MBB2930510.1 biopolymer transport protein ExbD [Paraburkholderia silvatlantica]PVY30317.1 biopolymer transport protein ExbD [Paraburkholderia silvatlantica]PXW36947.1 biopolymer transport protein ExbD [Paraburkholderia silvatlantica]PYE21286.1 biopolymer transport protein ExbD [Paraburkholderia silvatlantica]TDQ86573.1 biopolymer transport protein ExbD [Paraburkholderia silvatlantica]